MIFIVASLLIDMNVTLMHGFYRNQLARMWIASLPGFGSQIPLTRLNTTARGAPYHLISAPMHIIRKRFGASKISQENFLFSQLYCGSESTKYRTTDSFPSGSTILRMPWRSLAQPSVRSSFGIRWCYCCCYCSTSGLGSGCPKSSSRSRMLIILFEMIASLLFERKKYRYCCLTDGGHYESLGVEPLLLRRCKLIVVSDVTCDPSFDFSDLVRVHQRMRIEHGIRFYEVGVDGEEDIDLVDQRPKPNHWMCTKHYRMATIVYPKTETHEESEGLLVYLKPSFTGKENLECLHYRRKNPEFPHDSTTNQFFPEEQFEAYRELEFHIAEQLFHEKLGMRDPASDQSDGDDPFRYFGHTINKLKELNERESPKFVDGQGIA
ncbi:MAG: hypothetical protein CMJ78_23305 [Planctomycetaceae bacterium]|nr:hypothetical protein [Planctomycetaceae bacterium]